VERIIVECIPSSELVPFCLVADNSELVASAAASSVRSYLESARARNTIRGYRSSFRQFEEWCRSANLSSLPAHPKTIALYVAAQASRLRVATIEHHLAAVKKAHIAAGFELDTQTNLLLSETLKGVKRTHGTGSIQKAAILTDDLRLMLRSLPAGVKGTRDRAVLLVGFAGAFRRSELVGIDVCDLSFESAGLKILLRHSKTDQERQGRTVAIPNGSHTETCPVRAIQDWLKRSGIIEGPVFRPIRKGGFITPSRLTGHAIATLVKAYAGAAGLLENTVSGHSLRAGFVTSAARAGEPERRIMLQTGHKSVEMVLRYVRRANVFTDNAALSLGL
jgi:integrase